MSQMGVDASAETGTHRLGSTFVFDGQKEFVNLEDVP